MFDEIDGLPLHPLAIHAPVVLIPLAALLALVYVIVPPLRRHLAIWLVLFSAGAAASSFVAVQSGRELRDDLGNNADIEKHEEFGERVLYLAAVLAAIAFVLVLNDFILRARRRRIERLDAEAAEAAAARQASAPEPQPVAAPADAPAAEATEKEKVEARVSDRDGDGDTDGDKPAGYPVKSDDDAKREKDSKPTTSDDAPPVEGPRPTASSSLLVLRVVSTALSIALLAATVAVVYYVVNAGDSGARMVW